MKPAQTSTPNMPRPDALQPAKSARARRRPHPGRIRSAPPSALESAPPCPCSNMPPGRLRRTASECGSCRRMPCKDRGCIPRRAPRSQRRERVRNDSRPYPRNLAQALERSIPGGEACRDFEPAQLVEQLPVYANPSRVGKEGIYCFSPHSHGQRVARFAAPGHELGRYAIGAFGEHDTAEKQIQRYITVFEGREVLVRGDFKIVAARYRQFELGFVLEWGNHYRNVGPEHRLERLCVARRGAEKLLQQLAFSRSVATALHFQSNLAAQRDRIDLCPAVFPNAQA